MYQRGCQQFDNELGRCVLPGVQRGGPETSAADTGDQRENDQHGNHRSSFDGAPPAVFCRRK